MFNEARLVTLVLCLATVGGSRAWADDESDVLAANTRFERGFSSLDIKAVEAAWAHDDNVTAIHPVSKTPIRGWDAVRKSWADSLSRYAEISVSMDEPRVIVGNGAAWVIGIEKVHGRRPSGETSDFSALTTNIFERRGEHWLMVHHHASRMPQ